MKEECSFTCAAQQRPRAPPVARDVFIHLLCRAPPASVRSGANPRRPNPIAEADCAHHTASSRPARARDDARASAAAQEGPLRLTLEEAIARAEQNSLRVAELQARVEVAAAVEAGREAASRPALAFLGGYTRTNHVDEHTLPLQPFNPLYPDVPNNYRTRADLQWPIYTGGRQEALGAAAGAEREAAGFDVATARLDARLEAARAFWALVTATQTEAVVQRALDTLDSHLRDLRSRLDQGLIPPNDVLTAEAQRSHQQVLAIEARNLRQVAKADLRRVIGEDSGRDIEAAGVTDAAGPASPPPPSRRRGASGRSGAR